MSALRSLSRRYLSTNASAAALSRPHVYSGFTPPHPADYKSCADKLKGLPLTTIVDALWTLKYPQPMVHNIAKCTKNVLKDNLVGLAITLRFVPFRNDLMTVKPKGYDSPEYAAFCMVDDKEFNPNGFQYSVVMETVGPYESIGGDIKLSMLKDSANISSIVCDGGIRDIDTVEEYGIPIYAASMTCKQGPATQVPWSANEVISLNGDVVCCPHDYVVSDNHNVVVVPQCTVHKVIGIAHIRESVEEVIKLELEKATGKMSLIPKYYPFATPTTAANSPELVSALKSHGKWDEIEKMQKEIFG